MPESVRGAERVRASVELTRAERTAELRFLPTLLDSGPSFERMLGERSPRLADGLRVLQGVHRGVMSRLNVSDMPGPAGRVDFVHDRALYRGGGGWVLTAPGWDCIGEPGKWEADALDDHANPERLAIDVWLDDAGRIRRAILLGERTLMKLELSDFGGPDTIELPASDEMLPPDG